MGTKLLDQIHRALSETTELFVRPLDKTCSSLYLQITERDPSSRCLRTYAETLHASDFTHAPTTPSILFLKLALQHANIMVQPVTNLIWQKVVVGKEKADAALSAMMSQKPSKQYRGLVIVLSYPEHMILVLPELVGDNPRQLFPNK
jgi:hypothetical protein